MSKKTPQDDELETDINDEALESEDDVDEDGETDDVETEGVDDVDEVDPMENDEPVRPVSNKRASKASIDSEEVPSYVIKQKERDALEQAMKDFLSKGGKIEEVESNLDMDAPRKPDAKYGSRPI